MEILVLAMVIGFLVAIQYAAYLATRYVFSREGRVRWFALLFIFVGWIGWIIGLVSGAQERNDRRRIRELDAVIYDLPPMP